MTAAVFAFTPRRGLDPAVVEECLRRREALRGGRGAGGAAPGVGGVTHPPQSAPRPLPPPPAVVELPLVASSKSAAALHRVGNVFAFTAADLEAVKLGRDGAPVDTIEPAATRWGVPEARPGDPVCVARGVDTLHLAVYAQLAEHRIAALVELMRLAREGGDQEPVFLVAGGFAFRVTWTRPPYTLALDGAAVHLRIARSPGPTAPQVYAEVRAGMLWRDGPVAAVAQLEQMIRGWEVPRDEPTRFDVSRIDLTADFTGLAFTGAELVEGRWITRAVSRALFSMAERADPKRKRKAAADAREDMEADRHAALYIQGRKHTGTSFGRGSVVVRAYDKTEEIQRVGGKGWFRDLWKAAGWDGVAQVWRIEAQIRGPALASMVATAHNTTAHGRGRGAHVWPAGAVTAGKSWPSVMRALDAIWRYVVGTPGGGSDEHGWISLRDPTANEQPTRWPVSAPWRAVQAVPFADVVELYAGRAVAVKRLRQKPSKAHEQRYQEGMPWAPSPAVPVPPRATAGEVARAIDGPQALETWGDGPVTREQSKRLDQVGRSLGGDRFDIASAEERAAMMRDQVCGGGATWAAMLNIIDGTGQDDPLDAGRRVAALMVEAIEADPQAFATKMRLAKVRSSMGGAIIFRREVLKRDLAEAA